MKGPKKMASFDVFGNDAFSMTSLTGAIETVDYLPNLIGSLGIFEKDGVRTKNFWVDRRDGELNVIATSERNSPNSVLARDTRNTVSLSTVRLAQESTITAAEIADWRAFGSESEFAVVQTEYALRMKKLRDNMEYTMERHRLGALQGILLDADDSVLFNYFTEFGETQAAEIDFALGTATTEVRNKCNQVVRQMKTASRGSWTAGAQVHAICGDTFYDDLISHSTVKESYLNWAAAADLREGTAYESFKFGGLTFHNYQGSDDGSEIAIAATEAKFFPVGVAGVFKQIMSPADEYIEFANTKGLDVYALNEIDPAQNKKWNKAIVSAYPLFMCQKPRMLQRGKRS